MQGASQGGGQTKGSQKLGSTEVISFDAEIAACISCSHWDIMSAGLLQSLSSPQGFLIFWRFWKSRLPSAGQELKAGGMAGSQCPAQPRGLRGNGTTHPNSSFPFQPGSGLYLSPAQAQQGRRRSEAGALPCREVLLEAHPQAF